MNLHEVMLDEWQTVFLNLNEFGCEHDLEGKKIVCIVSDQNSQAKTRTAANLSEVAGLGIIQCDRVVYCHAADLLPAPLPGQKVIMDGCYWYVGEAGVCEIEGMFRLPLNRAF